MSQEILNRLMQMRAQAPAQPMTEPEPPPINEAEFMATPAPQQPGQQSIADYIRGMQAQAPQRGLPKQPMLGSIPSLGALLQMLQGGAKPDAALDARLGQQVGSMEMNNQRHRTILDDFARERAQNQMMLGQLQGVR
jgi:hypothetical protein